MLAYMERPHVHPPQSRIMSSMRINVPGVGHLGVLKCWVEDEITTNKFDVTNIWNK